MATYTPSNRLILQATNENVNTWGDFLNNGGLTLIDSAMDGVTNLALTGNVTLTTANGASDEARRRVLNITSTGGVARTVTIPSVEKFYVVRNAGTSTVLIKTAAGVGVVVLQGQTATIFCDSTECYRGGVSGWGKLSNTPMVNAVTTFDISLAVTGQKFSDALLVFNQCGATSLSWRVTGAGGNSAYVGPVTVTSSGFTATLELPGYTMDAGKNEITQRYLAANASMEAVSPSSSLWRMTGGLTAVGINWASITSAGSIDCYLR